MNGEQRLKKIIILEAANGAVKASSPSLALKRLPHQRTKRKSSSQRWHRGPLADASVFTQALRTRSSDICKCSKKVLTCCIKGSCHGWPRGEGIGGPFSGHFTA